MPLTRLSTKGQIVIPEVIRSDLESGAEFFVARKGDLIILKKISGLSEKEQKEMELLQNIWEEIGSGRGKTYTKSQFLKKL